MDETIISRILSYASTQPEKIALKFKSEIVDYLQLKENVLKYSASLQNRGVGKGDIVLLSGENKLEFIFTYFAVHYLGAVNVVIDSHSNPERLQYIITATKPKLKIGGLIGDDIISYEALTIDGIKSNNIQIESSSDGICDILFTTGTTAAPKGVCLSHRNELAAATNINEFIGNTENDIELIALPLCHSFGLGRLRCTLYKGATAIILNGFTNVKKFFTTIDDESVTGFGMVPAAWNYLKKASGERIGQFKGQLKYIEIGSAPMPIDEKKLLCQLLPETRICMHYGLTEASRSTFSEFHENYNNLDSVGIHSPNVEVRVKDIEGKDVATATEGEICVKGGHVMEKYLDEKDNATAWYGDFFRTGDWGYMNDDGRIYLKGRGKELINVGGKKLSPEEVEREIMQLGWFTDCACVGIVDPNGVLGEVVKCYAVKGVEEYTIGDLTAALQGKLEVYKIPVQLEYLDKIPTTESGKKQRLQLKNR